MSWMVILLDGVLGQLVQRLQQLHGLGGAGLGAVNLELLVAVGNLNLQCGLDGAQMLVGRAAQVRQAQVVVGGKGVAQDHA